MTTNGSVASGPSKTLESAAIPPDSSQQKAINNIEIDALVDSRVQLKLQEFLGPFLTQLLQNAGNNLQDGIPKKPPQNSNAADSPDENEGVRFLFRNTIDRNEVSAGSDPRQPQTRKTDKDEQNWLTVTKVFSFGDTFHEVVVTDKILLDSMKRCLSSFIAHIGVTWKQDYVSFTFDAQDLLLNFKTLSDEVDRQPTEQARSRLRELLDIVRAIFGPSVLAYVEGDLNKDFRTDMDSVWPLFCPGNLIVAKPRGFDCPQLLKVDEYHLRTDDRNTVFTVSAWMWDWNGEKLVRSMYRFGKDLPEQTRVNPREWDFYPVEFYEDDTGGKGLDAFRRNKALSNRRHLFLTYTRQYASKYHDANVLRYFGDTFADAPAFASAEKKFQRLFNDEDDDSKLVELDEDIILDTKNYCRRVDEGRKFADWKMVSEKFCECGMCMDQKTKIWYDKMNEILNAEGDTLDVAVKDALDMACDNNDLLLAPRVFGFALNRKEWCQFWLDRIEQNKQLTIFEEGAKVEGLVFPSAVTREERQDIYKLIKSHKRVMSNSSKLGDTISGKEESLILLFHGHSGTGKTLYAEALANACELGLFKVGTSDIGLEAARAERRLKEIFQLAEAWNTVLLIDEADVLLDTRGRENESLMSKNALVSVLLREVEYFKGILIMTTNRVRAFDPAILSRVHHALDFQGSTQEQEYDLWMLWYERMERKQACIRGPEIKKWIENTNRKKKRNFLSGREIRNVFLTAQILAEDESKGIKIGRDELEKAYQYKLGFVEETEGKTTEAKAMMMSGMRQ